MTLSYETIFSDFLGSISDVEFASFDINDAYEMMTEWLHRGLGRSYIKRLFVNPKLDDEIQKFYFEMENSVDEDSDMEFTINILAKSMVVEWLKPQVRSRINISQMFGKGDEKFFSQSSHLKEIRSLLEDTESELRKEIRDRGYINNSYLGGQS